MSIPNEKKLELEKEIREVNSHFDPEKFKELFLKIHRLSFIALALEIEQWLIDLQQKEKLPLINGILSWLSLVIGDTQGAIDKGLLANQDFPNTDIWETIIKSSGWVEFYERILKEKE